MSANEISSLKRKIELLEFELAEAKKCEAAARKGSQLGPVVGVQTILYQAVKMKQVGEICREIKDGDWKNLPLDLRRKIATIANLAHLAETATPEDHDLCP